MKRAAVASVLVFLAMAGLCWRWMDLTTDLDFFLPDGEGEGRLVGEILRGLSQSPLSRRIVFVVSNAEGEEVAPATRALQERLAELPISLLSGADVGEPLIKAFFEHRYQLVSLLPEEELPQLLNQEGLASRVADLKSALNSPAGALVRQAAVKDPLLLARRPIERLALLNTQTLQMQDGVLQTHDGRHGVVFASSHAAPFDSGAQTRLWHELGNAMESVRVRHPAVTIETSSLSRYAVAAEASMRSDVTRVTIVSTLALVGLLLFVLARVRHLPLMVLPLAAGFVGGTFACLALFGEIHAMTFAFGSALIGVCIDYPIHIVNHMTLGEGGHPLQQLRRNLMLGCLTTVVGLGAMAWGALPGLRQIAAFGGFGVSAALVASLLWLPTALRRERAAPRHLGCARLAGKALRNWLGRRKLAWALLAAAGATCVIGLPRAVWQDDPQSLTSVDAALEAEDRRVRALALGREDNTFAYVVSSGDEEAALQANEALARALARAQAQGSLGRFASISNVLWSADLQARNQRWIRENLHTSNIEAALAEAGFVASAFTPFGKEREEWERPPLLRQDLPAGTQAVFVAPWSLTLRDGRTVHLARLTDVRDDAALQAQLATVSNAGTLDIARFRGEAYATFRQRLLMLLAGGFAAVLALLCLVYRSVRAAVAALAPALLSAATAASVLTLMGVSLNLMHLMGLLLVLSMGADYGIFMVGRARDADPEAARHDGALGLSLLMACASTVLSFGLLAASSAPALAAVGQMVGLGITLALLLAPAMTAAFALRPSSRALA